MMKHTAWFFGKPTYPPKCQLNLFSLRRMFQGLLQVAGIQSWAKKGEGCMCTSR